MPDLAQKKDHFQLNLGLNTESNEVSFPDGHTTEEQNYELLIDGSRRRRKGCSAETGSVTKASGQTIGAAHAYATHNWRGVSGDPTKNFIVHQVGSQLFFTDDAETISSTYHSELIPIDLYRANPDNISVASVASSVCQFSSGRGVLLVTGKYITPFYVSYTAATDTFSSTPVSIQIRDFYGVDDGVQNQVNPASITPDHQYNLRNRGWTEGDISGNVTGYFDVQALYPSKNQIWYRGYRRITDVGYSDLDGIQEFDSAKLVAEQFGTSSAPQGALLLNPMDTRYSGSTTNEDSEVPITAMVQQTGTVEAGGTVRVTAVAHGRSTSDVVTIAGNTISMVALTLTLIHTFDGYHTITKVDNDNFDISHGILVDTSPTITGWAFDALQNNGQINGNVSLPRSDGVQLDIGPTACAYFAGRAWYAGIQSSTYADTVFFSKIALEASAFGTCHQEADPTNPEFNQLASSDGGHMVIPNLGNIKRMLPIRDVLLIFSDQGVWEIGGGQRGVFTATGYSVRKVTEAECSSSRSPLVIGNRAIYTGPRGVHIIAPNKYTSILEESSLSEQFVQSLWNAIPTANQRSVYSLYDSALKRVYFLYGDSGDNANHYANALVLDMRVGAYFKYVFNTTSTVGLLGAYAISDSDSSDSNKKVKWTAQSSDNLITCDLDQTDYLDFDGSESPLPYFMTGWDNIGSFQRRRQAPVITVFAKSTETGYTDTGSGYTGDNESSNLLTAYWDWTNDSVSGKIGSQNETYRKPRAFVPASTTDVDGYPVVVSRSKLRGRGRVLQLRFDGAATKDSHILGFTVNYKVSRNI